MPASNPTLDAVELKDLSDKELKSLTDSIDTLSYFDVQIENGESLDEDAMGLMIAQKVKIQAFKTLLGKEQWTDEEFVSWTKKSLGNNNNKELKDLSEEEVQFLIYAIDGLSSYDVKIENKIDLNAEDMAAMIALKVNIRSFQALVGKEEWSDEEFMQWVREESRNDNEKSSDVAQVKDLSLDELKSLVDSIDGLSSYDVRIENGTDLNAEDMAVMIALKVKVGAFKTLLGKEQWSDEEFMQWVREESRNDNE